MASIEQRKNSKGEISYRAKVRLKGNPTESATFKRLTDARKWVSSIESAMREGRHFKTSKAKKHTFSELVDKYEKEVLKVTKKNFNSKKQHLRWWKNNIGSYTIADIKSSLIAEKRNELLGSKNKNGREIGKSTVNRYVTSLSHVFNYAINQLEWIETNPVSKLNKLPEPRGRVRFLDDEERKALIEASEKSENKFLKTIIILALSTGARKNEILNLKWQDVDMKKGQVTLHETKNDERRTLPIKGYALKLLKELHGKKNDDCEYLFPSPTKCKPLNIRTSWEVALKRANIENFRFHDLRHSAASYLAMNGASLAEIAGVLGHKTLAMVKRYAHLSEAHTASVVERMNKKVFGDG